MFNQLIASNPGRRGFWTARTISVSVIVHLALLVGAVYASSLTPEIVRKVEEEVTFLEIEEPPEIEQAPEIEAEPEPPPPVVEPVDVPPPPVGFQELIPPIEPPAVIPDIQESLPPVDPADFSGIGIAGGSARGIAGGTPQSTAINEAADSTFAYEVAVLESAPALINERDAQRAMTRFFPRLLLDAGISGSVVVRFVIEADGSVNGETVEVLSASHEQFAAASRRAIEAFRFRPGRYGGRDVRVLIQMPISWQAGS